MGDINIKFPIGGIHEGAPFTEQPPSTTSDALNVTGQDPVSGRTRGAQRAGMSKYNPNVVGNNKVSLIQGINYDASLANISAYASGSEPTSWAKTLPNKSSVWCIATDLANNAYVVDSGATIVKYNPTGYPLYTYKVPVKDEGHEIRSIAVDQAGIIYVAVSSGGQQNTAHIFALEEIEGTAGQYLDKIWEYKTEAYVCKLVYASGKIYAAANNPLLSESCILVLSNVGTAVPTLDRKIQATYPLGDISISPKDGGITSTSPINLNRGGERTTNSSFKSPKSVDWDLSNLEGFEQRVWAWLDAKDIDGDGTNNEAYADGEEIQIWFDKSGNGRDLAIPTSTGYFGPSLSKGGFNGLDCLSFSGSNPSGAQTLNQYLKSGTNPATGGSDTASNANNPQNLGLIPSHLGASFAMFIVFEATDDGVNPQHVFSQNQRGYINIPGSLSSFYGNHTISAHHLSTCEGAVNPKVGLAVSATFGYSPGNCTLLAFGSGDNLLGETSAPGANIATESYEKMQVAQYGAITADNRKSIHSGSSKSNRFIVSYIFRGKIDGNVRSEPVIHGASAVSSPGYATTTASHYRVNGRLCQTFLGGHHYSNDPCLIGRIGASVPGQVDIASNVSFKGRVCEIIVLKEWYYRADETSAPVRLNVCSSRPPAYTTSDHGEYSSIDYLQRGGNQTSLSGLGGESLESTRVYESELIEGYLAHKWGIADELPNELVGFLILNGASPIGNTFTMSIPSTGGTTENYAFTTSATAPSVGGPAIYIPTGGATVAQLRAQAYEIVWTINGDPRATRSASPAQGFYAMPPTFSALDNQSPDPESVRNAIIEIRLRNTSAQSLSAAGVNASFSTTSGRLSFKGYSSSFTGGAQQTKMVPRSRITGTETPGLGINYSVHPFAEHRRQVHENNATTGGWTIRNDYVTRTLGGPPRADGKRAYQPLQVYSSSSQNLVKYDKDSGKIKWSLYNGSPQGVVSGGSYTGYGGLGFSVAVNQDGLVYSSGQRSSGNTYPPYTESARRNITATANSNDVRATNDLGGSASLAWQKQVGTSSLDNSPGWARSVVDEKKNLVLPVLDQETTTASLVVYEPTAGNELHRHVVNAASDQYQVGLSAGASAGTLTLPSTFTNPRSEFVYLGTRCDNTSIVTFTAQPAVDDTITLSDGSDTRTYTFKSAASSVDQVAIGGSLADAISNLRNTINGNLLSPVHGSIVVRNITATQMYLAARDPEPSGGTGVFTFSTTGTSFASMSTVAFRDACLRRVNLINAVPTGTVASFRSSKNVAVDGDGKVYTFGDTAPPALVSGESFSSTESQYYDSAVLYQKMYITNGFEVLVYDPVANTTTKLESKQGGSPTERFSLITSWRGRLVLGRSLTSPHNWIMSAIGDPTNWDLFPPVVSPSQAVSGAISRAGLVPDVVNALIPYNDDLMLFGGDHSIYRLTGDPMSGGQMDLVTDVTGIAFGHAWDKDPQGVLYFMSSRGALYAWPPGGRIIELSLGKFEQRLSQLNFSESFTQLIWNDMDRTLHIFTLPFGDSTSGQSARHFRYERDSKAFWEDSYGRVATAVSIVDGDAPSDRRLLIGSDDNVIRKWDTDATDDDGVAIDSYVTFGPFGSQETELRLSMIQAVLSDNQGGAHVQLFASDTPDVLGDPVWAGKLTSGRNPNMFTRVRGSYFWIRIRNSSVGERWAFENMIVRIANAGRRRVR